MRARQRLAAFALQDRHDEVETESVDGQLLDGGALLAMAQSNSLRANRRCDIKAAAAIA